MAVLVAGGTGALGGAVLRELAAAHAVTGTWIVESQRDRIEAELGDAVTLVRADLFDPKEAADAVAAVEDLEAVVNLVGGFAVGPKVHEAELADFEQMLRLNLVPGFNLAHAATPPLSARGGRAHAGAAARAGFPPFPGAAGV